MWRGQDSEKTEPLFNQIILAAADIDHDVFFDLARQVKGAADGFTLYANAKDIALNASSKFSGGIPRIGLVTENGPTVYPDIDTIDASNLPTGEVFGLKHSDYADHRTLLDDIGLLLNEGLRPPNRRTPSMRAIDMQAGIYWRY